MQNPDEDTEWNDLLRKHKIIPQKEPEVTEEALAEMIEKTIEEKQSAEYRLGKLDLEEINEAEDDEDEELIRYYRNKRIQELKAKAALDKFGSVEEITAVDYVEKVNNAGEGIFVILHLYRQGIPLCSLINQFLERLSIKFPQVKFLKSISTTCIPNYPDHNLPTIFVYLGGKMKGQFVGPHEFGGDKLKYEALEWMLSRTKSFVTDLEEDPRGPPPKVVMSNLDKKRGSDSESDDGDDW